MGKLYVCCVLFSTRLVFFASSRYWSTHLWGSRPSPRLCRRFSPVGDVLCASTAAAAPRLYPARLYTPPWAAMPWRADQTFTCSCAGGEDAVAENCTAVQRSMPFFSLRVRTTVPILTISGPRGSGRPHVAWTGRELDSGVISSPSGLAFITTVVRNRCTIWNEVSDFFALLHHLAATCLCVPLPGL